MLILERRKGESVRINDDITIRVIAVKGESVKIAFDAPAKHSVHREEVYKRIHGEASTEEVAS